MQSILLRIMTLIVAGHRRMISSTVISGSMVSGLCTVHVSKERHLSSVPGPELCAGANNGRKDAPRVSRDKRRACRIEGREVKVAVKIPLCVIR